jgi:hypothetical protein
VALPNAIGDGISGVIAEKIKPGFAISAATRQSLIQRRLTV